jgi:hypothetical protein
MYKVFTEILPRGILPALSQQISRASKKLGIFESKSCLRCLQDHDVPEKLDLDDLEVLCRIVRMCTDSNFFQILCTRLVEFMLLGLVEIILDEWYVFMVFDL